MVKIDLDLSGVKIPKKVAGVKVPKKLRKQGNALIEKANSPAGRDAIAAGLTIAATALAGAAARGAKAKADRQSARHAAYGEQTAPTPPRPPEPPAPPRAPGQPGIDPNNDLGAAIANGIGAFQRFLKDKHG